MNASHTRLKAPKSTKSVPKGPSLGRSRFIDHRLPDGSPEPLDDDSFFEPIYSKFKVNQEEQKSASPTFTKSPELKMSPLKIHPFYAKNKLSVMAKVNTLLKAKGPPRAPSASPPPSMRPHS